MEKEPRIYKFSHKFHRILCYFSLLMIPLLLIVLIYNFNVLGLFICISLSILVVLLCYWYNNLKLILYEDKIILHNFKKHIFLLHEIQTVSLEERGYIKFVYNDKIYLTSGFICIFFGEPNKEKNVELVKLIKKEMKKARDGRINRCLF